MKASLASVIALAVLAAGCITGDPASTATVGDLAFVSSTSTVGLLHGPDGAALPLPAGFVPAVGGAFSIGLPSSEPTIALTSDGAVFMTANKANPSCSIVGGCPVVPYANFNAGPTLMRSVDGGQSWEDVFPKLPTGDSYKLRTWDPMVYVDRDTDRVFMDDIYPIGCGFMSWSDDGGASWGHNPAACGNPNVNDHQTIGTAKPRGKLTVGYPNFVYRCVNNGALSECAISPNGGQTFLPQIPVAPESGCGGITGHLESDSEGRMFLPMSCSGETAALAVTEDDGTTWTLLTITDKVGVHGLHIDIAIDEADNLYAMWPHDGLPVLSVSVDHGVSWSEPVGIAAPDVTLTKFNAIAAGAPGKVAFSYVGTTIADARELPASECGALPALPCSDPEAWADATWNAYIGIIEDALSPQLAIQTVTANEPSDPIARGACGDRCHGMTDFIDIQIGMDGRPWASFVDVCTGACVTDKTVLFEGNSGLATALLSGPALRGAIATLPPLAPSPTR